MAAPTAEATPALMKRRLLRSNFLPFGALTALQRSIGFAFPLSTVSVAPNASWGGTIETRSTAREVGDDWIAVVNSRATQATARIRYGSSENDRNLSTRPGSSERLLDRKRRAPRRPYKRRLTSTAPLKAEYLARLWSVST